MVTVEQARPLSGLRVLDLSWGPAAAIVTMFLADYGAEVIHVERPGGDPCRRRGGCRTWDRGKRNIVLDLGGAHDVELLRELAHTADVVVDGLGPGRLERLGPGFEDLRLDNPELVLLAFGVDDDDELAGYDAIASARYGVMAESPGHRDGPIFPGHPAPMYGTALVAIVGVLAALRARVVTGAGDRVDVSTRDGVLALMTMNWWNEGKPSFIDARTRTGRLDLGRTRLLLDKFRCADGRLIQVHTGAAGAFGRAMEAFGLSDVVSRAEGPVEMASPLTDRDLEVLSEELPSIIAGADSSYWLQRLWDHEVACLPVQPPGVVFDDDQVRHAGIMATVTDPDLGEIEVVGPVVALSSSPAVPVRPRARPDADGEAIRSAGWLSDGLGTAPNGFRDLAQPLSDVRIVEFSNYFASPSGNRLLRDLGADVIKVEPVHGDPIRSLPDPCEGANGGKRSIAIDMKSDRARPVIERLMASADVIQHNMRPGAAERIRIDESTARGLNPSVIYAYGPGYGSSGPKATLQSFAPLHSGFVGLMHLAAGEGNEPHTCFGNEDYYAGLLSAAGILLAVIHRDRHGEGQRVEVAQLLASVFVTSEHFVRDGTVCSTLPTLDAEQSGWSPTYRIYQCLEGWLCVSCVDPAQEDRFLAAIGLAAFRSAERSALAAEIQDVLFGRRADEWLDVLRASDVPCEIVWEDAWLGAFLADERNVASGASVEIVHPQLGRARVIGSFLHLRSRQITRSGRAPLVGEHTNSVLYDLGITAADARALQDAGVTAATEHPLD